MTHLHFSKCMKYLCNCYMKDFKQEQLSSWYEYFKDVEYITLNKAVKEIISESQYFPTISVLKEKCQKINKRYLLEIVDTMLNDGYFKRGAYGELSDQQAFRNYEKTIMWLENNTIPYWLKEDMKTYMDKDRNKKITKKENLMLR